LRSATGNTGGLACAVFVGRRVWAYPRRPGSLRRRKNIRLFAGTLRDRRL